MSAYRFGLLGYPLGHSMSPFIHHELFALNRTDAEYGLYPLEPSALSEGRDLLFSLTGFNVTIPYKRAIIPFVNQLDDSAARYQSVNTVLCSAGPDGKPLMIGCNTDVYGFHKAVSLLGGSLSGRVLLLGTGGTARMAAMETLLQGGSLTIAARNPHSENAVSLLAFLKQHGFSAALLAPGRICGPFDLIVNCTPVGMYPNADACPVDDRILQQASHIFDAVYNPKDTLLIKKAAANGAKALSGMPMLVWQAVRAQELWLGVHFSEDAVAALIDRANWELAKKFPI